MSAFNLPKTLRALGLAAAVMGSFVAHDALAARTLWTVDGVITVPDAPAATASRTPLANTSRSPAQTFLELSGATGGGGQHS
ncbi:hypothetical protein [Muricoccus vinaceus]|uniref:Uncharacterized protein n=1 Tax=Muricoccus vinaceus TaxID=424704 RepID=A0ABV6IYH0_9PROT